MNKHEYKIQNDEITSKKYNIIHFTVQSLNYPFKVQDSTGFEAIFQETFAKSHAIQGHVKVACRVQIWIKAFCQNSDKFGYSLI